MKIKYFLITFFLCNAPLGHAILGWVTVKNKSSYDVKVRTAIGEMPWKIKAGKTKVVPTRGGGLCFVSQDRWSSTDVCKLFYAATWIEIQNNEKKPINISIPVKVRGWWLKKPGKWKYPRVR